MIDASLTEARPSAALALTTFAQVFSCSHDIVDVLVAEAGRGKALLVKMRTNLHERELFSDLADRTSLQLLCSSGGLLSAVVHGPDASDQSARTDFFDYHADGLYLKTPPLYCALYCTCAGRGDIGTTFIESSTILSRFTRRGISRSMLGALDQIYVDRNGAVQRFPILRKHPRLGIDTIQYSVGRGRIVQRGKQMLYSLDKFGLTTMAKHLDEVASDCPAMTVQWSEGDLLIWDNYSFLHSRRAREIDLDRRLVRYWLGIV